MALDGHGELVNVGGERASLRSLLRSDGVHDRVEALSIDEFLSRDRVAQDDTQLADFLRVRDLVVIHLANDGVEDGRAEKTPVDVPDLAGPGDGGAGLGEVRDALRQL